MADNRDFQPDWVSPPGETILDILEERNLSSAEFARLMGKTPEYAEELISGGLSITIEVARKLEVVVGASAAFWMNRESQYRSDVSRLQNPVKETGWQWVSGLPLKDMIEYGWLKSDTGDEEATCLRFFDVPDVPTWHEKYRSVLKMAAFRTSPTFSSQPGAVAAWIRQGEIEGAAIECKAWDANRFKEVLPSIRSLTWKKEPSKFLPELERRCAECGVAVAVVRAPAGCRASGATRFLSSDKALLLLSFRYLSDDHFWFTFFHEAAHLLLHGKKSLFLEGADLASSKEEVEANDFAASTLIPPKFSSELLRLPVDGREVIRFARHVGVSPGIIVGQLQHLKRLKPNQLNSLKRRFTWTSD